MLVRNVRGLFHRITHNFESGTMERQRGRLRLSGNVRLLDAFASLFHLSTKIVQAPQRLDEPLILRWTSAAAGAAADALAVAASPAWDRTNERTTERTTAVCSFQIIKSFIMIFV